jgi:uncharacterized membrane protein
MKKEKFVTEEFLMGDAYRSFCRDENRQMNRDCLATFLPWIKTVIAILLAIGSIFLGLTVYFYQTASNKMDVISQSTMENTAAIVLVKSQQDNLGKSVLELQGIVIKKMD